MKLPPAPYHPHRFHHQIHRLTTLCLASKDARDMEEYGDGVMCMGGADIAQDDDERRGVRDLKRVQKRVLRNVSFPDKRLQTSVKTQPPSASSTVDARVAGVWSEADYCRAIKVVNFEGEGREDGILLQRSGASQML
jgi:hypothetical protein